MLITVVFFSMLIINLDQANPPLTVQSICERIKTECVKDCVGMSMHSIHLIPEY